MFQILNGKNVKPNGNHIVIEMIEYVWPKQTDTEIIIQSTSQPTEWTLNNVLLILLSIQRQTASQSTIDICLPEHCLMMHSFPKKIPKTRKHFIVSTIVWSGFRTYNRNILYICVLMSLLPRNSKFEIRNSKIDGT